MAARLEAFINPEVLRWARTSINMDPVEAADRIGTSRDRLIDWEDGIERPSIQQLRKASEVYKRPLAAFYLPEPPRDFRVPNDFRRLPEAQLGQLSSELLIELRRMQYQRSVAISLADAPSSGIASLVGSVTQEADAKRVGASIRDALGITLAQQRAWATHYEALNRWKHAIEKLGVLVFHFERVELTEARGISVSDLPFPIIGLNGKDTPRGRIFTLLHEFSHLLLDNPGICDTTESRNPAKPREATETFCNATAGNALVPAEALLSHPIVLAHGGSKEWRRDELRTIADHYWVSTEVVLRRLLVLGRTTNEIYEEVRRELAGLKRKKSKGGMSVPRRVLRRIGQPFARIVIGAYHEDRITGSDAAEYLGTRLKWIPDLEDLLGGRNVLTGGDR